MRIKTDDGVIDVEGLTALFLRDGDEQRFPVVAYDLAGFGGTPLLDCPNCKGNHCDHFVSVWDLEEDGYEFVTVVCDGNPSDEKFAAELIAKKIEEARKLRAN